MQKKEDIYLTFAQEVLGWQEACYRKHDSRKNIYQKHHEAGRITLQLRRHDPAQLLKICERIADKTDYLLLIGRVAKKWVVRYDGTECRDKNLSLAIMKAMIEAKRA